MLNARCVLCHNNQLALGRLQGGLNLSNFDAIQRVVLPGQPIKSPLFTFANTGYMPPGERPHLNEKEKDILYFWIYNGASDKQRFEPSWQWLNQQAVVGFCTRCHHSGQAKPALDFSSNENYQHLQPYFAEALPEILAGHHRSHPMVNLTSTLQSVFEQWLRAGAQNQQIPQANWTWINDNIIQKQCRVCHNDQLLELDSYEQVMELVIPGNPLDSPLYGAVESGFMPQDIPLLQSEVDVIYQWIANGAPDN